MVDVELVTKRLRHLADRLGFLREVEGLGKDRFLEDHQTRGSAERDLQLAIQAALDVANHIVAEDSDLTPESYGAAFVAVGKLGVIEAALADRLRSAAGLRNVLVHAYLEVDPERVWEALGQVEDLEAFAAGVKRYVEGAS